MIFRNIKYIIHPLVIPGWLINPKGLQIKSCRKDRLNEIKKYLNYDIIIDTDQ